MLPLLSFAEHEEPWSPPHPPAVTYERMLYIPYYSLPPVALPAPMPVVQRTRFITARVTACSPEDPLDRAYYAAHGYEGRITRAVAADLRKLPRGTMLKIPGYAREAWVPVDSRGGSVIRASTARGIIHIDVKFATAYSARKWGSQILTLEVKE